VTGAEDVTKASERRHTQSGDLPELLGRPSTAWHLQLRFNIIPAHCQSFNTGSLSSDPDNPEGRKLFYKERTREKEYLVLGAIAGVFTGVANGMQKEFLGTVSPVFGGSSRSFPVLLLAEPPSTHEFRSVLTFSTIATATSASALPST